VVNIGAATFGKPYGFQPRSACNTVYSAVNFETFNAADVGRYTSGLAATCNVTDDLSKALGDPT
jgi:carboxyl-terminal processing protease